MEIFWKSNLRMPVSFPMGKWVWTGIWGVQIGNYFIGATRGNKVSND